jgi:hypothetical protein
MPYVYIQSERLRLAVVFALENAAVVHPDTLGPAASKGQMISPRSLAVLGWLLFLLTTTVVVR